MKKIVIASNNLGKLAEIGAILTPLRQGNAATLTCRFHGWTYGADGRCIKIKNEESGYPAGAFDKGRNGLTPLPRVATYRGHGRMKGADGGVLAKCAKPGQEERADLPTIGPLLCYRMYRRGFYPFVCGHDWRILRLQPRFDIPDASLAAFATACREELDHLANLV